LERADAVKDLLVKAGVPADRIRTEGLGSEKPIAPNDTEANRAKNRRIEISLVRK
jgi:outer membrane protein OmpA-like peptidoglycan-associated protein